MEKYELIYKIEEGKDNIRLLGEEFFKKNKASGYFIFNNIGFKLKDKIRIKNIKQNELKIEIRFWKEIYDKSYMFKDCESLIKFLIPKDKIKESSSINMENNALKDKLDLSLVDSDCLSDFSDVEIR